MILRILVLHEGAHDRKLLKHLAINYSGRHQSLNYKFQHLCFARCIEFHFHFQARTSRCDIYCRSFNIRLPLVPIFPPSSSPSFPPKFSMECIGLCTYLLFLPPPCTLRSWTTPFRNSSHEIKNIVRKLVFWQMAHVQNFRCFKHRIGRADEESLYERTLNVRKNCGGREKRKSNSKSIKICIVIHRLNHVYEMKEALQAEFYLHLPMTNTKTFITLKINGTRS